MKPWMVIMMVLAALAALTVALTALFVGPIGQKEKMYVVVNEQIQNEETLNYQREHLFDEAFNEAMIKYARENLFDRETVSRIVTEKNIAEAFKGSEYDEAFQGTPLRPLDPSGITKFVRTVRIQIGLVPLEPDRDGKLEVIPIRQSVDVLGLVGASRVIIPNVLSGTIQQFPPTLDDGRPYKLGLNAVLLPDIGTENSAFQEPLGQFVYPGGKLTNEGGLPVIVFKRTRPILTTPKVGAWDKIAPASVLREGASVYYAFNMTGTVKAIRSTIIEVLPNGGILFEGNFSSPVAGSVVFTREGEAVALVVNLASQNIAFAMPLEQIMQALVEDGVVSP